jgi:hypothetical protein
VIFIPLIIEGNRKKRAETLFQRSKEKPLLLFLVQSFLVALGAELHDLHLVRMAALIAGGDIVLIAADAAF